MGEQNEDLLKNYGKLKDISLNKEFREYIRKFIERDDEISFEINGYKFCLHGYYDGFSRLTVNGLEALEYVNKVDEVIDKVNEIIKYS